jgi:5-methylcytosine-specific restriction endonuclease McrA
VENSSKKITFMSAVCKSCNTELTEGNWSTGKREKGWYSCNACHTSKYKKYRNNNPFKARLSYYNKRYGGALTVEDLETLWSEQSGKCGICKTQLSKTDTFCLDHITSRNDGGVTNLRNIQFLCEMCNVGKHKWTTEDYIQHCVKVAEEFMKAQAKN